MLRAVSAASFLLLGSIGFVGAAPPKSIVDAIAVLEKGLADSNDPTEKEKLKAAIAALKRIGEGPKQQNEIASDFLDNPGNYKGQTVTFKATYVGGLSLTTLRDSVGKKEGAIFLVVDPKNKAKLYVKLHLPATLKVPAAKEDDEVVVTFKCNDGEKTKGNVAVEIVRP